MPPPTTARDHGSPPPRLSARRPAGGQLGQPPVTAEEEAEEGGHGSKPREEKRGGQFYCQRASASSQDPRRRWAGHWQSPSAQSCLRTWTLVSSGAAHSGRVHVWALHCPSPAGSIDPQTPGPACTGRTPHAPLCAKAGTGSSPSGHWAPRPWAPGFLLTALSLRWGRA